jgi:branched-chain amino acid aminotransferase
MEQAVGFPDEAAWLDGRFLPRETFALPVGDAGFVMGATVTEQLRTFRGELFLPEQHARRLAGSLRLIGLEPPLPIETVMQAAAALARHNHRLLPAAGEPGERETPPDLGLVIFVTAGDLAAQHGGRPGPPRVGIHSFPLAFSLWASAYDRGVALRSVSVTQVPETCWPLTAKVRSRLHYWLADREAAAAEPGSRAVLAHSDGRVSETSTANIAVISGAGVVTPPAADALPGVSLGFARGLAERAGIAWQARSLTTADLAAADEILLTSTPNCLLPVTRFDGRTVGSGRPGPVCGRLLAAWSQAAGIDIAAQARHHARST